ncbi:msr0471 [Mesorhizobium japonicum MAFF 303099]|uniref:Msr0471 protein n=1 Tax=Mesorhizobium japonicum (strain LMG 29417 / CECT 9101 / MAFF 303099) TaxID=266835 RepID=Q98MR3_RHILO|nr:msr0471 [Mesorhizobium japonicum MAFF 303099]
MQWKRNDRCRFVSVLFHLARNSHMAECFVTVALFGAVVGVYRAISALEGRKAL